MISVERLGFSNGLSRPYCRPDMHTGPGSLGLVVPLR